MQDTANIYSGRQDEDTMGGRLQRARDAAGLSVSQVAARLGVRSATVQAWESDRSQPRANKLQMVAGLLNVGLAWLMDGLGRGPAESGEELIESISTRLSRLRQLQGEFHAIAQGLEKDFVRLAAEARG
ncbi:MAG: helix-turn-helix transcriptional regulator [Rhizobiaceae bacterium]|nr:helix-turn-helix transcriptional regulator [Rhizobiaceae bacterium]